MKKCIPLFYWLSLLSSALTYAQDPPPYQNYTDGKREETIAYINTTLNHIHKVRDRNPDSALHILQDLYKTATRLAYREGMGGTSAEIGGTYLVKGEYEKAERYTLYSLLFPKLNEYITTNASNNLYLIYESRGQYELAIQHLKKAMASKDKNVASIAYNNYITLLLKLGKYKESLYYIQKLKEKAKVLEQHRVLAAALCNEAMVYNLLKQYKKFDSVTNLCLQLCRSYPDLNDIATYCIINTGTSYYERGNADSAISFFLQVKDTIPKLPPDYQMNYYSEYGTILYKTGAYPAAIRHLSKSIELAKQIGIADNVEPVYFLAKSYRALGEHERAGSHFETYIRLKDSFRNIAVQKSVHEYEVKFRTVEKDNELLSKKLVILNQADKLHKKNTWILVSLTGLLILALLFFAYIKYARQRLIMLRQKLDLAQQQARIDFLEAIMQGEERERKRIGVALHNGIGSQLTAINLNLTAFQWKNKQVPEIATLDKIITQIQHAAVEVRKTAHNLLPADLLELGLFEAVKDFTRQFNPGGLHFELSESGDIHLLPASFTRFVYQLLQELIHNAVKHANATIIAVHIALEGPVLAVTVTDNGKGFATIDKSGKGKGIQQIQEQLLLLKANLKIHTPEGGGTAIHFEIDIKHAINDQ